MTSQLDLSFLSKKYRSIILICTIILSIPVGGIIGFIIGLISITFIPACCNDQGCHSCLSFNGLIGYEASSVLGFLIGIFVIPLFYTFFLIYLNSKNIFSEKIDYSKTGDVSIWGKGDKTTLDFLKTIDITGNWLNLAAGDGRYSNELLEKVDSLIASDIDRNALNKLWSITSESLQPKLKLKKFNIVHMFPFKENTFDGVFCTGILHLFEKQILKTIFREVDRVLKPKGMFIFDFATDIKRTLPNGSSYKKPSEPDYELEKSVVMIEKLLPDYNLQIIESAVPVETVSIGDLKYNFSCKFILIKAIKS
jgi:SAM-dependent methyltransferase